VFELLLGAPGFRQAILMPNGSYIYPNIGLPNVPQITGPFKGPIR